MAMIPERLDCGDHSCRFAVDKSGMRTNGGCRCLLGLSGPQRIKVYKHVDSLTAENDRLEAVFDFRAVSR